jgi:hypothetical protein
MSDILMYIIGFLSGIFLILTLLSNKCNISKILKYFRNNMGYNKDDEIIVEDFEEIVEKDVKKNSETIILENFIEEDENKYDDNDKYNTITCNKNIINKFKIERLLKKKYLIFLISSYNVDNLDNTKLLIDNKSKNSDNINVTFSKKPYIEKYPLNPNVNGFNIKDANISINIPNNYNEEAFGLMWEKNDKVNKDENIEYKSNEESFKKLKKNLDAGNMRFTEKDWESFKITELKYNNYVKTDNSMYIPLFYNTSSLDISTYLLIFKFRNNNNIENNLMYINNKNNGNLISINIIDSSDIIVNNIDSECKTNEDCNNFMISLHNNINKFNEYEKSTIEYDSFYNKNCKNIEGTKCSKVEKNHSNEFSFYKQMHIKKTYTIQIKINIQEYNIYNVSEDIFNDYYTFMGLIINNEKITFYINNSKTDFIKKDEIKLNQSYPIYINYDKKSDIVLYSFAFFKDVVCDADISSYKIYNNNYLNGFTSEKLNNLS